MMAEIIRGIEFRKGSSTHENEKRIETIEAMSKQRKEWKKKGSGYDRQETLQETFLRKLPVKLGYLRARNAATHSVDSDIF